MSQKDNKNVLGYDDKEREETLKKLSDYVDQFLGGKQNDFDLKLEKPLKINEDEFRELIGYYDSLKGVIDNGIFEENFFYILYKERRDSECTIPIKRLYIKFNIEDDNGETKYILHHIRGLSEKIELDCNNPQ